MRYYAHLLTICVNFLSYFANFHLTASCGVSYVRHFVPWRWWKLWLRWWKVSQEIFEVAALPGDLGPRFHIFCFFVHFLLLIFQNLITHTCPNCFNPLVSSVGVTLGHGSDSLTKIKSHQCQSLGDRFLTNSVLSEEALWCFIVLTTRTIML